METLRRHASTAAMTSMALALAACGGARSDATTAPAREALDLRSVVGVARAQAPGAIPIEVEHETLDGAATLEVEVLEGGVIRELYFDPATGALLQDGVEELAPDEAEALPALEAALSDGGVTLEDAVDFALATHADDDVREVELELHDGRLVLEVGVRRNGEDVELVYDAVTRELLSEETEAESETETPTDAE